MNLELSWTSKKLNQSKINLFLFKELIFFENHLELLLQQLWDYIARRHAAFNETNSVRGGMLPSLPYLRVRCSGARAHNADETAGRRVGRSQEERRRRETRAEEEQGSEEQNSSS
jgi:hypothetical protein